METKSVTVNSEATLRLKQSHPWIFANQVVSWTGEPQPGDLVEVRAPSGGILGYGYANRSATLAVRMLYSAAAANRGRGWPDEKMELERKLDRAWSRRQGLALDSNAFRLVWSEADGLPGVVCDVYGDQVVLQLLTAGADRRRDIVRDWLRSKLKPAGIYERSEGKGRAREGLPDRSGWLWRDSRRAEDSGFGCEINEGPLRFLVDFEAGHKTGFYLDQRGARRRLREQAVCGRVLDAFCYTGGFACNAVWAGAREVIAVDSSEKALQGLGKNLLQNQLEGRVKTRRQNVFVYLTEAVKRGERFDGMILDPPAFAPKSSLREAAIQGYRELHRRAAQLLTPGGLLLTCVCSHAISQRDLKNIALAGCRDAGRHLRLLEAFGPDADHPVIPQVPESRYLACLLARVG